MKDIESWRVVEFLEEAPNNTAFIPAKLDLGRARRRIIGATDKQLKPYAGRYPLVVALAQSASNDASFDEMTMAALP